MIKIDFKLNLTNCLNRKYIEYKDFVFIHDYYLHPHPHKYYDI